MCLPVPMSQEEKQNIIIEIRPGTGGEEAGLFVKDLFEMYSKYAKQKGWGFKVMSTHPTSINGFKEVVFELEGPNILSIMKHEAGVHRVQRIPQTEKRGRIHTSTVTVVVLRKATAHQVNLKRSDVEIESYKASGPGGQYTNKTETAIRVTHKSTGITATCQSEKSQGKNKANAIHILQARILQKQKERLASERTEQKQMQMRGGKRAYKIRTYNFPQNRITDHRTNKAWHNLETIMEGKLDPIIKNLSKNP